MKEISENIKIILKRIPNQSFKVLSTFKSDFFSGVFVVENKKLSGRIEDIKIIETYDPNQKEQFEKEAKILSAIEHPNIPVVYDLLEYKNYVFFRSQHIEGYSLREILNEFQRRNEIIPKKVILNIIKQLTKTLYYVHNDVKYKKKKESIIHCDIKPENIIININNQNRKNKITSEDVNLIKNNKIKPYLIDFGIAKFKEKQEFKKGTLNYMSLEQLEEKRVTWKTDIYQLCLVYDELLTNKKPFDLLERHEIKNVKKEDYKTKNKIIRLYTSKKVFSKDSNLTENCFMKKIENKHIIETLKYFLAKNRFIFLTILIILAIIIASFNGYNYWDKKTQSTQAILNKILSYDNISIEELDHHLDKLQKRNFEKHYLNPLIQQNFFDKETWNLLYPNYLNKDGKWIYSTKDDEELGYFIDVLFKYDYKELEYYKDIYLQDILNNFDKMNGEIEYYYALRNYNKDYFNEKNVTSYLDKVAQKIIQNIKKQKGLYRVSDLDNVDLFLFLYNKTNNKSYLEYSKYLIDGIINNNLDKDGYLYLYSQINFTTPQGVQLSDSRMNRLLVELDAQDIGSLVSITEENVDEYRDITGIFARDYLLTLNSLIKLYNVTKDHYYLEFVDLMVEYYENNSYLQDRLFLSKEISNNPIDNLALIRSISFYKKYDLNKYKSKLLELLQSDNFRKEDENAIIKNVIYIDGIFYNFKDDFVKNQSLIISDNEFLNLS